MSLLSLGNFNFIVVQNIKFIKNIFQDVCLVVHFGSGNIVLVLDLSCLFPYC